MKEEEGYCKWNGCKMNKITEEEQEECDYYSGDCSDCDKYVEE